MNKTKKIFLMLIMIYMICTTFVTCFAKNETNPDGKGTVTGEGTVENPYQLVLGEPIIDIYYGDYAEALKNGKLHFEFTSGKYNAANYIVENNVDKGRLRLKLQGSTEDYLKVTSQQGLNYIQAGGVCFLPDFMLKSGDDLNDDGSIGVDEISGDVQIPYYTIVGKHSVQMTFDGETVRESDKFVMEPALGNGYLVTDDTMLSNLSTYSTSYVFSKSNLDVNEAFKLAKEQKENINSLKINYGAFNYGYFTFIDGEDLTKINQWEKFEYEEWAGDDTEPFNIDFEILGPVRVVYSFNGTNSQILDMDRETPPIESVISKLGLSLIDVIVKAARLGGKDGEYYVTIDSLVFNEYPNTIVDFWGETNYLSGNSKQMINFWFNVFKAWAVVLYIVLLVYIGIKTMIVAGTSEQKKVKGMFEGWLIGLLMMFCFPFLFKYLIVINDMVVDIVRTNSKYSVYAYYTFENMYTKWGQEDGENSTTSVIDRLRDAAEQLKQDINDKNKDVNKKNQEIENLQDEIASKDEKMKQGRLEILSLFSNPGSRNIRCTTNKYRN